jgi:hypothetical protein
MFHRLICVSKGGKKQEAACHYDKRLCGSLSIIAWISGFVTVFFCRNKEKHPALCEVLKKIT